MILIDPSKIPLVDGPSKLFDDCPVELTKEVIDILVKHCGVETEPANLKDIFYDGYAHCLMDFGRDTVLCRDCKHYKQSAVADRKMCFRKDVDGVEVCYDFLPYDSCTYGERKDNEE